MKTIICIFILSLVSLVSGCAAESNEKPEPLPALHCTPTIVTLPEGERLRVECNRNVETVPDVCQSEGNGVYVCDVYHADEKFCDTFPGICIVPAP